MSQWTLYHYWRSSSSWRVRWALALKGIQARYVHVDLLNGESESAEHVARHPLGFVPVLDIDGRKLLESVSIIEWLDETIPSPSLYPGDAFARAHIRCLVEIIAADTQPVQNLNVVDKYTSDPEKKKEWIQYFIRRGLSAYETLVSKSVGKFSVGDQITAADLFLIPQCYNAMRFELQLSEFPRIEKIHQAAMLTEFAQASSPERFKP